MRRMPPSPRSRRTATRPTRTMTTRGITGIPSPSTPSTGWSWPWSPARTREDAEELVTEVKQRLGEPPPRLITSDELPAYATAIETVFGTPVEPEPTPRTGPRPILPAPDA